MPRPGSEPESLRSGLDELLPLDRLGMCAGQRACMKGSGDLEVRTRGSHSQEERVGLREAVYEEELCTQGHRARSVPITRPLCCRLQGALRKGRGNLTAASDAAQSSIVWRCEVARSGSTTACGKIFLRSALRNPQQYAQANTLVSSSRGKSAG